MLVLTRKVDESIIVDGDIEIMVVAVHGNRVKLGITAPDSIRIRRAEVGAPTTACETAAIHDAQKFLISN